MPDGGQWGGPAKVPLEPRQVEAAAAVKVISTTSGLSATRSTRASTRTFSSPLVASTCTQLTITGRRHNQKSVTEDWMLLTPSTPPMFPQVISRPVA